MTTQDAINLLDAFVKFAYNAEFDEFKGLYSTDDEAYLLDKYKLMQKSLGGFFSQLDGEHRRRFVRMIVDRYAKKERKGIVVSA